MKRRPIPFLLLAAFAFSLGGLEGAAWAQEDDEPTMTFDEDDVSEPEPEGDPEGEGEGEASPEGEGDDLPEPDLPEPDLPGEDGEEGVEPIKADTKLGEDRVTWQDIVVVVRKPFLKVGRLEILPQFGVTVNDNIIRHVQFNGQLNYFLTDVLAVGLEGHLYAKQLREPFDLVARQARRLPTVNKYNWGAALNFHYVPVYGKFAILDEHIVHWETFFTAGVGVTQSEVLPRDPAFQPFTNLLITPNVGGSMRFFLTKFITINAGIRDYIFVDKYEPKNRSEDMFASAEAAKNNADSSLINNVVFQLGVSFWFPTSFEYTTFR